MTNTAICAFIVCTTVYVKLRNPQGLKKKTVIQDWHLMLFVFMLFLCNMILLCLHVLLEGIVTKFNVATIPSKERPFSIEGVSPYTLAIDLDMVFISSTCCVIVHCTRMCRNWRFKLISLSISVTVHLIPGFAFSFWL